MYYMIYVPFIPCSYLNLFPRVGRRPGEMSILSPLRQFPPPLMDNYLLPLMVNISVALCTYSAPLFMYIVSMIGMEGEIQFVRRSNFGTCFISFFVILILFYLDSTIVFQIYFIICSLLSSYLYYDMGGMKKCRNIYKLSKYKNKINTTQN